MELVLGILVAALLVLGAFFALTAAVGLLRMPDFYTRIHPAGKADSMASFLILGGLIVAAVGLTATPDWASAVKLLLILFFMFLTAPTATHAICKAAYLDGLNLWEKPGDQQGTRVLHLSLRAIIPRVSRRTRQSILSESPTGEPTKQPPAPPQSPQKSPPETPAESKPEDSSHA